MLSGFKGIFPEADYFVHGRSRIGEAFLRAVAVNGSVIVAKQSVLYLDLCSEKMRKQGEDGCQDGREAVAQMVVGLVVSLGGSVEVRLGFGQGDSVAVRGLGLLHARVDAALVAFEIELFVLSFLDGLPQHLQTVLGILGGLDHLSVYHAHVLRQITLELFALTLHASCPCYGMHGSFQQAGVLGSRIPHR